MRAPPESFRPMTGAPDLHGQVHDLADLRGEGLGERAAEDGEVLGEDEDRAALDPAVARDHAVAGDALRLHAEVVAAVHDERVQLLERAGVEQDLDPLARGELARRVLLGDALLAAAARAPRRSAAAARRGASRACLSASAPSRASSSRRGTSPARWSVSGCSKSCIDHLVRHRGHVGARPARPPPRARDAGCDAARICVSKP